MGTVVLGSGYVGRFLAALDPGAVHTSRQEAHVSGRLNWRRFDAADPATWGWLEGARPSGVIVSFPFHKGTDPAALAELLLRVSPRVVCIGSTSAFSGGEVDDDSPVDPADPRAAAEEVLRREGAVVLHAAGIYGPGRNPLDWVRRGLIGDGAKVVNLVHGEDVARACLFLLGRFTPGERLVISDGRPRCWSEIVAHAVGRGTLADPHLPERGGVPSKRVVPRRLPALGFVPAHPDLLAELDLLEGLPPAG